MSYVERQFQQEFKEKNVLHGCFELKLCKGISLPFSNVADHQVEALLAANSEKGLYHKLTDQPVSIQQRNKQMRFTRPKPFDCSLVSKQVSCIVIMFYVPRKKKNVYYIDVQAFVAMKDEADRKSITEKMAERYCCRMKSFLKK